MKQQILIGKIIIVKKAKNKSLEGLKGKIIEESKQSFMIETKDGPKRILKSHLEFISFPQEGIEMDARLLAKREKDRLKQKIRKKK